MAALFVPDGACLLLCLVAAFLDLRTGRIPNWLTLPGVLLGLVLNIAVLAFTLGPGDGLKLGLVSSLAGSLLLLLVFGLLGAIHFVGMGDVKLMAAVGALLRWPTALWALAYVALAGGVIAVGYALVRGRLGAVAHNLVALSKRAVRSASKSQGSAEQAQVQLHRIPYATAILVGAAWAVLAKYVPALRLP